MNTEKIYEYRKILLLMALSVTGSTQCSERSSNSRIRELKSPKDSAIRPHTYELQGQSPRKEGHRMRIPTKGYENTERPGTDTRINQIRRKKG